VDDVERHVKKNCLLQAKTGRTDNQRLLAQAMLLSTWRGAAFVTSSRLIEPAHSRFAPTCCVAALLRHLYHAALDGNDENNNEALGFRGQPRPFV
jgi:hypothetical protein